MDEIIIRLANDNDFEAIFQIWLDGIENSFDKSLIPVEVLQQKFANNFNNRQGIFNFWVAASKNEVLGWQSLMKTTLNPFKSSLFAESSTYIAKDCRLKGLGQILIDYVLKEAEKSQLEYVVGYVAKNNAAARKLTQATGWIEIGEMPPSKKGKLSHTKIYLVRPV